MDTTTVKGYVPRNLRRQAFAQFAMRDLTFSAWLRAQLARWLEEVVLADQGSKDEAAPQGGKSGRG